MTLSSFLFDIGDWTICIFLCSIGFILLLRKTKEDLLQGRLRDGVFSDSQASAESHRKDTSHNFTSTPSAFSAQKGQSLWHRQNGTLYNGPFFSMFVIYTQLPFKFPCKQTGPFKINEQLFFWASTVSKTWPNFNPWARGGSWYNCRSAWASNSSAKGEICCCTKARSSSSGPPRITNKIG